MREREVNWALTRRVRSAIRENRVLVSLHVQDKMDRAGLGLDELTEVLSTGVVLTRKERDEKGTALDGYKHFLHGMTPGGRIYEVVFKMVKSLSGEEELVVLITLYRGRA